MAISLNCPHCDKGLHLSPLQSGARVLCPYCGGKLTVPAGNTAVHAGTPTVRRPAPPAPASPPKTRPLTRPQPAVNYRIVAGAAAAALLLTAGLVVGSIVLVNRSRPAPAQPPAVAAAPAPVELIETEVSLPEPDPVPLPTATEQDDLLARLGPPAAPLALPEPPPVKEIVERRRNKLSDEELRRQLLGVPELKLDRDRGRKLSDDILATARRGDAESHFTVSLLDARADLAGLPLRRGADCQLGKEPAENLQNFSRKLRQALAAAQASGDPEIVADAIRKNLEAMTGYHKAENGRYTNFREAAIPTVMQMLCVENQPVRLMMIDFLDKVDHPVAGEALAKMALFDLSEKIRAEAIRALSRRPRAEYRAVLLQGLRYPWPAVADHAAEALVILEDRAAVPTLKRLAEAPDPAAPYFDRAKGTYQVNEMVRINHLGNCAMCHAPSTNTTDLVRGRIPTPGQPLPPLTQYYESNEGIFVRADVTYLKQDFSVVQPVERPGAWPTMQRFDYVVRSRPVSFEEGEAAVKSAKRADTYPQREAVLYAIKELERR